MKNTLLSGVLSVESQHQDVPEVVDTRPVAQALAEHSAEALAEQLHVASMESENQVLELTLQEIANASATLESLRVSIQGAKDAGESISLEQASALRATSVAYLGQDMFLTDVSLESLGETDATDMSLEGLGNVLKKFGNSIRSKNRQLFENLRWLQTKLFNGLAKNDAYLKTIERALNSAKEGGDGKFKMPAFALTNLQVDGSAAPKDIIAGLKNNVALMKDLGAFMKKIDGPFRSAIEKMANDFASEVEAEQDKDKRSELVEALPAKVLAVVEKEAKPLLKHAGKQLPGGRTVVTETVDLKRFNTKFDTLAVKRDVKPKADYVAPSIKEAKDIASLTQENLNALVEFKAIMDSLGKVLEEVAEAENAAETSTESSSEHAKKFLIYMAMSILVALVASAAMFFLAVAGLPAATLTTIWYGVQGAVLVLNSYVIYRLWFKKDASTEAKKDPAAKFADKLVNDMTKAMVDFAKAANTTVRAGTLYSHAAVASFDQDVKEPEDYTAESISEDLDGSEDADVPTSTVDGEPPMETEGIETDEGTTGDEQVDAELEQ